MKLNFRAVISGVLLIGILAIVLELLASGLAFSVAADEASVLTVKSAPPVPAHFMNRDLTTLPTVQAHSSFRLLSVRGRARVAIPSNPNDRDGLAPSGLLDIPRELTNPLAPSAMPAPIRNFQGIPFTNDGYPPDTNGDVGPNHYIQSVNVAFAIFSKTGTLLAGPIAFDSLWSGAGSGTPCDNANFGDPISIYDPLSDRWLITDFAFRLTIFGQPIPPYYECLAISATSNPLGSYYLYAIPGNPASVNADILNDYPKFGIGRDAIYMSANMYDTSSNVSVRIWAFNRADMIAGAALNYQYVDLPTCLATDTFCEPYSLLPMNIRGTAPISGSPEYFANVGTANINAGLPYSSTTVHFWKMTVSWSPVAGIFSALPDVSVPVFTQPLMLGPSYPAMNLVPQPGTTTKLDTLGDRLMYPLQYRRLPLQSSESLWATHSITQNGHTAIRWYEFRIANGIVSLYQAGNFDNNNDGIFRWLPSIAADANGNMAVGYNASSTVLSPSLRYAGRLRSDALNTLAQGETTLVTGGGSQVVACGGPCTRWGDYATMSVDPTDDCTFWFTSEYYTRTGGTWNTRIGSFQYDLNPSHTCKTVFPNVQYAPLVGRDSP